MMAVELYPYYYAPNIGISVLAATSIDFTINT